MISTSNGLSRQGREVLAEGGLSTLAPGARAGEGLLMLPLLQKKNAREHPIAPWRYRFLSFRAIKVYCPNSTKAQISENFDESDISNLEKQTSVVAWFVGNSST